MHPRLAKVTDISAIEAIANICPWHEPGCRDTNMFPDSGQPSRSIGRFCPFAITVSNGGYSSKGVTVSLSADDQSGSPVASR